MEALRVGVAVLLSSAADELDKVERLNDPEVQHAKVDEILMALVPMLAQQGGTYEDYCHANALIRRIKDMVRWYA